MKGGRPYIIQKKKKRSPKVERKIKTKKKFNCFHFMQQNRNSSYTFLLETHSLDTGSSCFNTKTKTNSFHLKKLKKKETEYIKNMRVLTSIHQSLSIIKRPSDFNLYPSHVILFSR